MIGAPPSRAREAYADVAVARQCEREGCNVQPSYGKVWKKVGKGFRECRCQSCRLSSRCLGGVKKTEIVENCVAAYACSKSQEEQQVLPISGFNMKALVF